MKKFAIATLLFSLTPVLHAEDKVDFAKSIKPIFEKACLDCHGAEKDKGDLRLHTKEGAFHAIVPGKAAESEVYKRISLPKDHDDIMPPKGDPLTQEQTDLIKKWIDGGAEWPEGLTLGAEGGAEKVASAPAADEFAGLVPAENGAAEQEAIRKLAGLGISVPPIPQNLQWKEATIRPQDPNKMGEALAELKNIPSLVDLNLANLKLKDEDVKHISSLSNLLRLHLENNPITDEGVAHIKGLTNLRYLNLYNTQVSDAGLDHLKGMSKLASLYLWQSKVTDEGAGKIRAALPNARVNRGEELVVAKVEEKKEEPKPEEKKAEEPKAEEKKAEEKKDEKPAA